MDGAFFIVKKDSKGVKSFAIMKSVSVTSNVGDTKKQR